MKALILTTLHRKLEHKEVPDPEPGPGEVLVQLKAAALNHRDLWITKGLYPKVETPVILGSDGAGVAEGREVIINPALGWGENEAVQAEGFQVLGSPLNGTFAEYIAIPQQQLFPKPGHLNFREAAALPLGGLTAYRAVFYRGRLQEGERVLISGIGGGVAQFAFQFALAAGAELWVSSSKPGKIEQAIQMGARGGALYTQENWSKDFLKETGGFDLIIDSAAGEGLDHLARLARPAGRIVLYGGSKGKGQLNPQRLFWRQLDILGSTMGSPRDFENMLQLVEKHQIRPAVDSVFPLREGNEALQRMEQGLQYGKIVLEM